MPRIQKTDHSPFKGLFRPEETHAVHRVAHEMELVYRLAVFDSFLNSITSFALASRPSKAVGSAQMPAGILLAKSRSTVVNDYIAKRAKVLSREDFGTRLQALRDILDIDIIVNKDEVDQLKRAANLRNAIVHEGHSFQFWTNDELKLSSAIERKKVTLDEGERLEFLNHLSATIYEQLITNFVGRQLNPIETLAIEALRPASEQVQK